MESRDRIIYFIFSIIIYLYRNQLLGRKQFSYILSRRIRASKLNSVSRTHIKENTMSAVTLEKVFEKNQIGLVEKYLILKPLV